MEPKNDLEILIVEDSPTQLEQLQHSLETHDYKVITAVNGKLGLEAARKHSPAIIISDILMPEMDGYDLCKAIRSDEILKDTPIVLLTSLSSPADVIEALKCGADNFIRKPYDEQNLLLRINNILMSKKLRSNNKFEFGVEISLGGNRHFITAERQQILDLLISTYEQAVELCGTLKIREEQISRSNEILRGIYQIAKGLNGSMTRQEVIEQVLDRALLLPDVRAGWFSVYEGESNFKLAGSRGLPPVLEVPGALDGDCLCRRKVLAGEINRSMNITECERLKKANGDTLGLRSHVTIPLKSGNVLMGILNLVGAENVLFDDNDLVVLNGIGNQIGAALDRCLIHENLEALVIERTAALTAEIIERKKTEESLRESENRYRTLTESAEDAIFILNRNLFLEYINEFGAKRFNVRPEELIGKNLTELFSPALFEERRKDIQEVFSSGNALNIEYKRTFPGNGETWISVTLAPLKDDVEGVRAVLGISRDITERKRTEEALMESEERFRSLYINATIGIYRTTPDGKILMANPALVSMLGYTSFEELKKRDLKKEGFEQSYSRELFIEPIEKYGEIRGVEFLWKRKDGKEIWVSESARAIRNSKGETLYYEGTIENITERKQAEEALQRSEEKYSSIFESAIVGIYQTTTEGRYLSANPTHARILGYESPEDLMECVSDLNRSFYVEPGRREEFTRLTQEQGAVNNFESQVYRKDGSIIWISETARSIRNVNNQLVGFEGVTINISEQKQAEQDLIQAKELAEKSNKLKDAFIANISHEIRTPLNGILGMTNLIKESLAQFASKDDVDCFNAIDSSSKRIVRTTDMILNFSRLQVGEFSVSKGLLKLPLIINNLMSEYKSTAVTNSLELTFENKCEDGNLMADTYCISHAISNLIDNALKYTHKGYVKVILYKDANGFLKVDVKDSGIGIDEEYLKHLFEPYTQEVIGYSRPYEGIGLGLSLVKKYLDLNNASISAVSKKGEGTTFTIHFAQGVNSKLEKVIETSQKYPTKKVTLKHQHSEDGKPLILIVEDNEINQNALRLILSKKYNSVVVPSASEALEALKTNPIELILMDISIQGDMNGLELTTLIKKTPEYSSIPVIAVTAHAFLTDRQNSLDAGCDEYISKPFELKELFEKISNLMSINI